MRKWLNILRVVLFPQLCGKCRRATESTLTDLAVLRERFRHISAEIRWQKAVASRNVDDLLSHLPERQIPKIRACYKRFRTRPVAEELLRRSLAQIHLDTKEALRLAGLASEVAERILGLHEPAGGIPGIKDVKALVRAHQANAHRVLCRKDLARELFKEAFSLLQDGSGDAEVAAQILSFEASLLEDLGQLDEALDRLKKAYDLSLEIGESKLQAKAMLQRGAVLLRLDRPAETVEILLECLKVVAQQPWGQRLRAIAHHNLADAHCSLGQYSDAAFALEDSEEAFQQWGLETNSSIHLYLAWTRGKIETGFQQTEEAEERLRSVHAAFEARGNPYDAALVALDLARLFSKESRLDDLATIAEETVQDLLHQRLHPEAQEALYIFARAARERAVRLEIIQAAAMALARYRGCTRASS